MEQRFPLRDFCAQRLRGSCGSGRDRTRVPLRDL